MLEGLPPNNAAHVMRLVLRRGDRARGLRHHHARPSTPAEAAVAAFEEAPTTKDWKGGPWLVEAYFGAPPDEANLRALIASVGGAEVGRASRSLAASTQRTGLPRRSKG